MAYRLSVTCADEDSVRLVSRIGLYRLGLICCELLLALIFKQPAYEILKRARPDASHAPGGWLSIKLSLYEVFVIATLDPDDLFDDR